MKFIDKYVQLNSLLRHTLSKLICSDWAIVDLPYHSNIGDILIWQGELELLSALPHKEISQSSISTFDNRHIRRADCILVHGGGNIGELYREHINFLFKIVDENPNKRILIFPQTINYNDIAILIEDAKKLQKHKDLHFCVRDQKGYALLSKYLEHVYLMPDMAFCIPISLFDQIEPEGHYTSLYLKRTDVELLSEVPDIQVDCTSDWPTFYHKLNDGTFIAKLIDNINTMPIIGHNALTKRLWNWYAINIYRNDLITIGTRFIKSFDTIYTTRLHGLILGLLCRKKVTVIDNSYGKNLNFVNTWLSDIDEVSIYK